ncbi:MAG: hypothetical protein ACYCST_13255 [Acidimicrobiales bacterium]
MVKEVAEWVEVPVFKYRGHAVEEVAPAAVVLRRGPAVGVGTARAMST